MTNNQTKPVSECPVCGSKDVEVDLSFADGRCEACGYVINTPTDSNDIPEANCTPSTQNADPHQDLREVIAVQDSSDENLVSLIELTEAFSEDLHAEEPVRLQAVEVATDAWVEDFCHGRTLDIIAAAAVDIACRKKGVARPREAVANAASENPTTLKSTSNALSDKLDIDYDPPLPGDYISYIRKQVDGTADEGAAAENRIAKLAELPAGDPAGIAAAAVYLELNSTERAVTFRGIADVVGLTKETVWARAEDLRRLEAA